MSVKTGKEGSLYIIDTSTAFTTEDTTEDGSTKIYQIDDVAMRMWNPNTAITVSTGTLDRDWMDHGVDWFTGRVKMTATGLVGLQVTGEYVDLQAVGKIYGWSVGISIEAAEDTEIGETWKGRLPLGKDLTITINRYRFDTVLDNVSGDDWVLIKLYEDADSGFWLKALCSQLNYTKGINAIDTDAITFVVSSPISYFS